MPAWSEYVFHALEEHALPCPFKVLTGCDCPACGLQRSWFALLKGNLQESLSFHPAGGLMLLLLLLMILRAALNAESLKAPVRYGMILIIAISFIRYFYRMFDCGICQ